MDTTLPTQAYFIYLFILNFSGNLKLQNTCQLLLVTNVTLEYQALKFIRKHKAMRTFEYRIRTTKTRAFRD
jgi:hypothetical protein